MKKNHGTTLIQMPSDARNMSGALFAGVFHGTGRFSRAGPDQRDPNPTREIDACYDGEVVRLG